MLSPSEIESLSAELISLYETMEDDLLTNVAGKLAVVDSVTPDTVTAWRVKKLDELGALKGQNIKTIAKYSKKSEEMIAEILKNAGFQCLTADEKLYEMAFSQGILTTIPVPAMSSPAIKRIISAAVDSAKGSVNLINTTALQTSQKAFVNAINKAYLETSLGVKSYQSAMSSAVRQLADDGITGATFVSPKGRVTNQRIDVAVRRSILSASTQATGKIEVQRADEWGSNLVEVTSHIGSRPTHAIWQGKIYSLKGGTAKYPNLTIATGYGSVNGLKGANCAHDFYPFFEGISEQTYKPYKETENQKQYDESQDQRKIEREIRDQKRRVIAADAAQDAEAKKAAQLKLRQKQAEMKTFLKDTGRTPRTNRQQVLGFDRSKAAQAVQAAKRNT